MANRPDKPDITLIGFGEAAQAFCKGWRLNNSLQIQAYDIKIRNRETNAQLVKDYETFGVLGHADPADCVSNAKVIFSLVTADQALVAGKSVAEHIPADCLYFDCNSCSPDTKREVSKIIEAAGGRYVDIAVMAPVYPLLHKVPLLICGPHVTRASDTLAEFGMNAETVSENIGQASSIKMVRSIMVKGLEALIAECVLAGRKADVDEMVLESLEKSYPGFNWKERSSYMLERMMVHGPRRAAEMREVALTVQQLGLENAMSDATTKWQQIVGELEADPGADDYQARADIIISKIIDRDSGKS